MCSNETERTVGAQSHGNQVQSAGSVPDLGGSGGAAGAVDGILAVRVRGNAGEVWRVAACSALDGTTVGRNLMAIKCNQRDRSRIWGFQAQRVPHQWDLGSASEGECGRCLAVCSNESERTVGSQPRGNQAQSTGSVPDLG